MNATSSSRTAQTGVRSFRASTGHALVLSIPRDADLRDGIIAACLEEGIRDAVVLEGHATLDQVTLHQVTSTEYPIVEGYQSLEGPWELVSLEGLLIDGELHAHVTVADTDRVRGGHLHSGSRVLYLAEVVVLELGFQDRLTREHEPGTDLWLLQPRGQSGVTDRPTGSS